MAQNGNKAKPACIAYPAAHISFVLRSFPFIKPCLPSSRTLPPEGPGWLHEVKLDGWRGQLHKCGGVVRLYSKRGNDLGFRFPDLARAVSRLPIDDVILDGEITALDAEGLPNFEALQLTCCGAGSRICAACRSRNAKLG